MGNKSPQPTPPIPLVPISASPPLQTSTHSHSNGETTATDVSPHSECDDDLAHQSRIVENVINRHTSQLTESFGNNLIYFSNKFIELGFISRYASDNILTQRGTGNGEKGSQLLNLVIENCRISRHKRNWFYKFVGVFLSEAAYKDIAASMTRDLTTSMTEEFRSCASSTPSSLSTSDAAHPVADQLAPPVKSFTDYVKTIYRQNEVERSTSVVKWPPTSSKVYINLVCIDRHSVSGRSREYNEVTEAMVRDGNVDVILNVTKGPIDFSELAKNISIPNSREGATSDKKNRRLILVEGAPGVGKSTFAWEFCRRWVRGEIAQQYQLVLLLRLREERISNAKCLEDLIYHPFKAVSQAACHELVLSQDFHAMIILEGFDELPDRCRKDGSVFIDLIAGKLLPLATVLVTSRPWATEGIRSNHGDRLYQHIEILGFTGHQITEYIESTLPQDKVSDLKAYLKSHPQIRAGMYIPLNSAIVVTVYEESQASGYAMPTTLTELYTCLTQTLLLRYLRGHSEYKTVTKSLQTYEDLPSPVYIKFRDLCKVAYSGTVGNAISSVVARHHASRYMAQSLHHVQLIFRDLPSDFDDLGFMDSVTELYVTRGAVSSHNFLHLTFQEFFAAVHISSMSAAQQMEHFKRYKEGRLKVVLRFLAGLNELFIVGLSKQEFANNFFQTPSKHEGSRYLMCCDAAVGIDLVQWLFEAQRDDVIEHVLGHETIEFDLSSGMLPLDYYSLGYCISHSQCQWVLGLGEQEISETNVRMLVAGASTRNEPRRRVVELKIKLEGYSTLQVERPLVSMSATYPSISNLFIEWKSILFLHQLSLNLPVSCDHIVWPDLSALQVLEFVISANTEWKLNTVFPQLSSLKALTMAPARNGDSLVYEDCMAIGDHVTSTTSLKELICFSSTLSDEKGVEAIAAALASNQSLPLERLQLECRCTFTATAGDSLAKFIRNTTTLQLLAIRNQQDFYRVDAVTAALASNHSLPLERLELECRCTFTSTAGDSLAKFITRTTTLQCLSIRNGRDFNRIDTITAALANNQSLPLERLELECNCTFTATAGDSLAQFITNTTTLQFLSLKWCTFSAHALLALARALNSILQTKILKDLNLTVNGDDEAKDVAHLLVEYPDMVDSSIHGVHTSWLNLSNSSISDDGAVALAQALHHNSTLTRLNLSNSSISDDGAAALAQALHHNSTLIGLNLSNCSIRGDGAVALAQALYHNSTLVRLYLSNNRIRDTGTVALAQALHHNSTLTGLYVSNNSITNAGAEAIAQALRHNSALTVLNLSYNSISDAGAVALAQALCHNSTLTDLFLSKNSIADNGAVALVQALHHNSTLSWLYLSGNNQISSECARQLVQARNVLVN